ncbi:hypothetical protein CBOM_06798 [Ceraceosorus bombacis]|uniref:Uncharacterized protein n=1 Tax=Ceraceosorus bombacis TaxID=401625 RepID=A0A0P1BRB4_9BASI|nr:hypothetical protein CBOM_06798 [Ceraceosorus bombacis]
MRLFLLASVALAFPFIAELAHGAATPLALEARNTLFDARAQDVNGSAAFDLLHPLEERDAFTDNRGLADDKRLTSTGERPAGAFATTFQIGSGRLFAWQSKTPHNERDAESVFINLHGVNRNANTYFRILNNAWAHARDAGVGSARPNSLRIAPLFFSTLRDSRAINASTLAWGDSNTWTGGDGSTNPAGSNLSLFSVYDFFLEKYSDSRNYPRMRTITFLGHGGGAQVVQRYAVLGRDNPAPGRISVRYVVANPSSMLYFTRDRPVEVDTRSCNWFDDFRYGLANYRSPYRLPGSAAFLFKRYASRDVRYLVASDDDSSVEGDQLCGGRAAGGPIRHNRSWAYWKYLNLLSGNSNASIRSLFGDFPALEPGKSNNGGRIPTSSAAHLGQFRGVSVNHRIAAVHNTGHSATAVLESAAGRALMFQARETLPRQQN